MLFGPKSKNTPWQATWAPWLMWKLSKTLTMYRLSEHSLAVETGRRQTDLALSWGQPLLDTSCCWGLTETELHFLTECTKVPKHLRPLIPQNEYNISPFSIRSPNRKLSFICEKKPMCNYCCKIRIIVSSAWGTAREKHTDHTHTAHTHTLTANKHTHIRPTQTANNNTHTTPHTHTHTVQNTHPH